MLKLNKTTNKKQTNRFSVNQIFALEARMKYNKKQARQSIQTATTLIVGTKGIK